MELFKIFGTIAMDNSEAKEKLGETSGLAEKASEAFKKIGTAAVAVGKTVATVLAAGAAAVGAIAKSAMDSYADYEQLVGGVETLFGTKGAKTVEEYAELVGQSVDFVAAEFEMLQNAQTTAMENAAQAYKTAGMSANEYMDTISGFAASLKQSAASELEAAEVGNMAVQDMADNANKMGTSMESIKNAYQGFAKQNYTMLDNLKLGYGGTKEEMERLLKDASALSGVKYDISNLVDVYNAIHVIQNEMGITGTTAKEASQTISGSLASTKAAWQNLLTGFADDSQDLGVLVGNVVDSATTAAHNIVPRIAQILGGISAALPQVMSVICAELPGLMEELLPGLISGAVALVVGLGQMVPSLVQMLFSDLPYYLFSALEASTNPVISQLGYTLLSVGEFWREIIAPAISDVGGAFGTLAGAVQPILAVFGSLLSSATGVTNGFDILRMICFGVEDALSFVAEKVRETAAWISDHSQQITDTITELWVAAQVVWDNIGQPIWDSIQNCVGIVQGVFAEKMPEIREFVSQCFEDIEDFWINNLQPCLEAIGNAIENVLAPIFEFVFESVISGAVEQAFQTIKDLWENTLKPIFTGITDFLTGVFTLNWKRAFTGLVSIVKGIFNGLETVVKTPINAVIELFNGFIRGLNKLKIPDWVPGFGGQGISIPLIPRLEKGGILEKGQVGLLEGNGAEAVVPLDQNQKWINAVARDMDAALGGGSEQSQRIIDLLELMVDLLTDYFPQLLDSAGHDIVTNDGVIVARYAPMMNAALGKISTKKERGR